MSICIGLVVEDLVILAIQGVQCDADSKEGWISIEDEPQYITLWEGGAIASSDSQIHNTSLISGLDGISRQNVGEVVELIRGVYGDTPKNDIEHSVVLITSQLLHNNGYQLTSLNGENLKIQKVHPLEEFIVFDKTGQLLKTNDLDSLNNCVRTVSTFTSNRQLIDYYTMLFMKAFKLAGLVYESKDQCIDFYFTSNSFFYTTSMLPKHLIEKNIA